MLACVLKRLKRQLDPFERIDLRFVCEVGAQRHILLGILRLAEMLGALDHFAVGAAAHSHVGRAECGRRPLSESSAQHRIAHM